jgi:hypothetical protein
MMTELEAVNIMLGSIGEAPISKLSDSTINELTDSAYARRALLEVSRDVQSEGWSWNTDEAYTIAKNASNTYNLPSNTLNAIFSPNRYPDNRFTVRGLRVWDRQEHTFTITTWTAPLIVDRIITQLEWDEMPHPAHQYIAIRAARIFSDRYVNSNAIYVYTSNDEEYARAMLIRSEESQLRNNMLWGSDRGTLRGDSFVPSEGMRYRMN